MSSFHKVCSNKYRELWVSDITEKDLNNLPIILLGLSDIKLFPIPIENVPKKVSTLFTHIQFFQSKITGRKLAAGTTTENQMGNGFNQKPINIIWDYQEIQDSKELDQIKETVVQVNYSLEDIPNKDINDVTLELHESDHHIKTITDIINHTETDAESKKLLESMIDKDKQKHAGKDEATIYLVKQLQKNCENKVKREEPEPFKYDENEFPPLNPQQQLKAHGQIMTSQDPENLGLDQYLKLNAQAYKVDIQKILKDKPIVEIGRENCSHCDPRFN